MQPLLDPKLAAARAEYSEKVRMYEALLHDIQMYREVVLDGTKVVRLLDNIGRWSYAHRQGNGELSEEDQEQLINRAFNNLRKVD